MWPHDPENHRTPSEILRVSGPPVISRESGRNGAYLSQRALQLQQFPFNPDMLWVDWSKTDEPLQKFYMSITPSEWRMENRWQWDLVTLVKNSVCINFIKEHYNLNFESAKTMIMTPPVYLGRAREVNDQQAQRLKQQQAKRRERASCQRTAELTEFCRPFSRLLLAQRSTVGMIRVRVTADGALRLPPRVQANGRNRTRGVTNCIRRALGAQGQRQARTGIGRSRMLIPGRMQEEPRRTAGLRSGKAVATGTTRGSRRTAQPGPTS